MGVAADGVRSIIVVTVMSVAATVLAVIRLVIRRKGLLGPDDYILIPALLFLWAQAVGAYLLAIKGGEGKPMASLIEDEFTWLLKMFFWPELGYTTLVVLVKTSILFSYKRIFGHVRTTLIHIYILMALALSWGIATFFVCVFQCTPIDKAWLPQKPGHCIKLVPFLWGNSVSNFIIDWMILAIPIRPIWKLQMAPAQKSLVALSFLLGSLACIASTIRSAKTGTFKETELSESVFEASVWTYIEPTLAIMSACLPFLSRVLGAKVLSVLRYITSLGSRTRTLLLRPYTQSTGRRTTTESSTAHNGTGDLGGKSAITKHTTTTVSHGNRPDQHELTGYSFMASAQGKNGSESVQSLV